MPIKSYLAHPHKGKKKELIQTISAIKQCEVIPSKNKEVLIIITDTETKVEDDEIRKKLENIETLNLLTMVSGFNVS